MVTTKHQQVLTILFVLISRLPQAAGGVPKTGSASTVGGRESSRASNSSPPGPKAGSSNSSNRRQDSTPPTPVHAARPALPPPPPTRDTGTKSPADSIPVTPRGQVVVDDIQVTADHLLDSRKRTMRALGIEKGDRFAPDDLLKSLDVLKTDYSRLGYHVTVKERWNGNRVKLWVTLTPVDIVRHVFIRGNWPMLEEEILKHLRYRAGSRLPAKADRQEAFDRQRHRILDFLRKKGYFEGDMEIVVEATKIPHVVNLLVLLRPLWKTSPLWFWNPNVYRLGTLTVEGNKALSSARIRKIFVHRLFFYKQAFSVQRFLEDIERLRKRYHKLGYPEVRVRHDFHPSVSLDKRHKKVNIHLVIREGRRYLVTFEGNKRVSAKSLRKAVTFAKEGSVDSYEIAESIKAIERLYQKKGFFEARVFASHKSTGPNETTITFLVHEGPRLKVRGIDFKGNRHFSSSKLRSVIKTKLYPKLGAIGLGSGGYVTARQLAQDVGRIVSFYRRQGYRYVSVWASVAQTPDALGHPTAVALEEALGRIRGESRAYVRFFIQEGRRVLVSSSRVDVDNEKLEPLLQKAVRLRPGKPFTEKGMAADLRRIKMVCANHGRPYVQVEYKAEPSSDRQGVVVVYKVHTGPLVRFGEIFVRGNLKTARSTVLHELAFKRGQTFSWKKVEESRKNLASLGVFRSQQITFIGIKDHRKTVHAVVQVTERFDDHGTLELGGGYSSDNKWFVSATYKNRNLFGWAKQFEVSGEYGQVIQKGRLTYRDLRLFRTRLILDLTGFIRNEDTVRLGNLLTYGLSLGIIKRFTERLQLYARYQIKRVRRREHIYRMATAMDEDDTVDLYTNTAALGPTVIWDMRDNPLVPKKGFQISASVRWVSKYLLANLLPAADFIHIRIGAQLFIPLSFGMVIAQGLRYDHGLPLGNTVMLPKTERFYAGGDTTVRGYEREQLYTTLVRVPIAPGGGASVYRVVPQGGNIRLLYNLELQFPIWKHSILGGLPLWGALFFDTGSLADSFGGNGLKRFFTDFKHSIGTALRIVTPVGAVSIEYAVPFEPSYGASKTGRFHFNFGFIF